MSKRHEALKDWEQTKLREKYWEKIFEIMKQKRHEKEEDLSLLMFPKEDNTREGN